jgi:hypothetical protein|tara:strand:- start:206 stop:430 length:225 start_codon:yes stop_codon:yes gene_type:complete
MGQGFLFLRKGLSQAKRIQTGFTSRVRECKGANAPVSGFRLKDWRLLLSWFATMRKRPEGAMAKFLGKSPPEEV